SRCHTATPVPSSRHSSPLFPVPPLLLSFSFFPPRPPPPSPLFPYTTLFRSPLPSATWTIGGQAHPVQPVLGSHGLEAMQPRVRTDRKSTRLNSSHVSISYAVFCLKKKNKENDRRSERPRSRRPVRDWNENRL